MLSVPYFTANHRPGGGQTFRARSHQWKRFSRVVRVADCQCQNRQSPGFDPSILRHSGIGRAADETGLKSTLKINKKIHLHWPRFWPLYRTWPNPIPANILLILSGLSSLLSPPPPCLIHLRHRQQSFWGRKVRSNNFEAVQKLGE